MGGKGGRERGTQKEKRVKDSKKRRGKEHHTIGSVKGAQVGFTTLRLSSFDSP